MLNKLNKKRGGFTLVEIMIVVAIIALLAAIAVPGFLRARKRSQASRVVNDLRLIDSAVDQYAIENNKATGASVGTADWGAYMKKNSLEKIRDALAKLSPEIFIPAKLMEEARLPLQRMMDIASGKPVEWPRASFRIASL